MIRKQLSDVSAREKRKAENWNRRFWQGGALGWRASDVQFSTGVTDRLAEEMET